MTWAHILFAVVILAVGVLAVALLSHPLPDRDQEPGARHRGDGLSVDRPGSDDQWTSTAFTDTVPNIQRAALAEALLSNPDEEVRDA